MSRTRQRAPRGRLTRERILLAALESADANGIDGLKMRELAQTLGFEAMALYRHVASKDAILEGIVDLVFSEVEPPAPSADWAEAIRSGALSLHEALERHPWAASLLTKPPGLRPGRIAFMEALLARLAEAGFADDVCYHAYHVLDAYIVGFSLWATGHSLTPAERALVEERLAQDGIFDEYPRLLEHHAQHVTPGPQHDVSGFEVGLDLVLEGLKGMRRGSASTGKARRRKN